MANANTHIDWLREQVPALVAAGILTEDSARRLLDHYPATRGESNWATVLFGILGAVLIGGGVILLLAHNWDQMSRPARVAVAFAPLLASQALAFWLLWTGRESVAWRECVGTLVALLAGACMGLVSQTYNLSGDFATFMLAWTLMSLPVAYLLRATLPALWYIGATVLWLDNSLFGHAREWEMLYPLLLLIVPLWWMENRAGPARWRPALLGLALGITAPLGLIPVVDHLSEHWITAAACGSVPAVLFLLVRSGMPSATLLRFRPFHWLGFLGVVLMATAMTFLRTGWSPNNAGLLERLYKEWPAHPADCCILVGWILAALALWVRALLRRDGIGVLVGALPALILLVAISGDHSADTFSIIMNAYVLALGVVALARGLRTQRLSVVNAGLLTIAGLVLCRFFDSDLNFVVRALVFIALGIGFIATNLYIVHQKKLTQGVHP